MTYRFTIPLDYTGYRFSQSGSKDQKFIKMMLAKRYDGGMHIYEFIKINIALYEHQPQEPMNQAIMTYSSLTDLSKLVVKYLKGIAYDSLNQVVGINANKYNGDKQKIEIEVIAYEE
jgi:hypothetical protein